MFRVLVLNKRKQWRLCEPQFCLVVFTDDKKIKYAEYFTKKDCEFYSLDLYNTNNINLSPLEEQLFSKDPSLAVCQLVYRKIISFNFINGPLELISTKYFKMRMHSIFRQQTLSRVFMICWQLAECSPKQEHIGNEDPPPAKLVTVNKWR